MVATRRSLTGMEGHHPAVEQYLETVLELEEAGIVPLRARIVERLGVSAPAVSETVKRLEREGYLTLDGERVLHLTESGRAYATSMLRKHRLAEVLLVDVLRVPWPQVHEEACRLEHAISDSLERHLVELLGDPGTCPHGSPIPGSANAPVEAPALARLSTVPVGGTCTVRRIDEHLQTLVPRMEELERAGLLPGTDLVVHEAPLGRVVVSVGGRPVELDRAVAAEVYVTL